MDVLTAQLSGSANEESGKRDVEILQSMPGTGRIISATLIAEAWPLFRRRDYHALRTLSGVAPVTRPSGKHCIVLRRYACNRRLADAVYHWARVASQKDEVSRARYKALRQRGHRLTGLGLLINWGAEYLWLQALGYESVFWRIRPLKVGLFLAAFIFSFVYFAINLRFLAAYLDLPRTPALEHPGSSSTARSPGTQLPVLTQLGGNVGAGFLRMPMFMVMAAAVLALIAGLIFAGSWDLLLRYRWSQHYGQSDPIFG